MKISYVMRITVLSVSFFCVVHPMESSGDYIEEVFQEQYIDLRLQKNFMTRAYKDNNNKYHVAAKIFVDKFFKQEPDEQKRIALAGDVLEKFLQIYKYMGVVLYKEKDLIVDGDHRLTTAKAQMMVGDEGKLYDDPRYQDKELYEDDKGLLLHFMDWCACEEAPIEKRKMLIFKLLTDICSMFPDKNQKIIITSFAAGKFLQDYFVLWGMITLGYTNIHINFIDGSYPDELIAAGNIDNNSTFFLKPKDKKDNDSTKKAFNSLRIHLNKKIKKDAPETRYVLRCYKDAYDYIGNVIDKTVERSNVFVMVDPGQDILHGVQDKKTTSALSIGSDDNEIYIPLFGMRPVKWFYGKKVGGASPYMSDLEDITQKINQRSITTTSVSFQQLSDYRNFVAQAFKEKLGDKVSFLQNAYAVFDDLITFTQVDQNPIVYQLSFAGHLENCFVDYTDDSLQSTYKKFDFILSLLLQSLEKLKSTLQLLARQLR